MAITALFLRCARSGASPIGILPKRNYSTVKEVVPLAYHLYEPTDSTAPKNDAPVVVMHGLFGSKQNNRTITLARDLNRPVYAVDLRNHGDSPHHKRHNYIAMAEDVEHFLVDKKLGPETTLLGHSMGAKAAMAVSLRNPSLVRDLVIVDNAPVSSILHSSFGAYIRAMRQIEESQLKKQSEADKVLAEYEPNLGIRQFLLTNLTRTEDSPYLKFRVPIKILGSALDEIGDFPFTPEKDRFEGRALFVRGTKSHYVPDEHIPTIGRFFPLFRLKDIDAGHWVISEKPIEFKEAVVEFLQNSE